MYGKGISREGSLLDVAVDLGIVKKSGAWFTYEGEQLGQGRENAKQFLAENVDIMVEISEKVKAAAGIGPVEIDLTAEGAEAEEDGVALDAESHATPRNRPNTNRQQRRWRSPTGPRHRRVHVQDHDPTQVSPFTIAAAPASADSARIAGRIQPRSTWPCRCRLSQKPVSMAGASASASTTCQPATLPTAASPASESELR